MSLGELDLAQGGREDTDRTSQASFYLKTNFEPGQIELVEHGLSCLRSV